MRLSWVVLAVLMCLFPAQTHAQVETPMPPIMQIENATASAVAWSPDGTMLAVGDSTGIQLYTEDLEFICHFEQPSEQMTAMVWNPDGKYIAAAGGNVVIDIDTGDPFGHEIDVWEVETGNLVTVFKGQSAVIPALDWNPESTQIVSGSSNNNIQIWEALSGKVLNIIQMDNTKYSFYATEIMSVDWSPDGQKIVEVSGDIGVFMWDADSGELTWGPPENSYYPPPSPYVVTWSPNGQLLATSYGLLNPETGEKLIVFENCPQSQIIDWHPNSRILAQYLDTREDLDNVIICDTSKDEILTSLEGRISDIAVTIGYHYSLDWHPDGQRLAGAAGDGWVNIWRVFDAEGNVAQTMLK